MSTDHLKKHIDGLGPDIYAIKVSDDGELLCASTKLEDDETMCPHYPPLNEVSQLLHKFQTVLRSELHELDRIGANVDLVSYTMHGLPDQQSHPETRTVVFKYYFHLQFLWARWEEMNIWARLSSHPNIVPFDRIVVEELYGRQRVVGFTSLHIAGGTLDRIHENPSDRLVFKLKWLTQLIGLIDDLNFKYGIQHQDVAPRNLVVDEKTDNIMLFDFNYSARIGGPLRDGLRIYWENRDDVKGVVFTLYEIITRDDHFRSVPHWEQDASSVLDTKDWTQHPDVRLDYPFSEYRAVLEKWLKARKQRGLLAVYTDAPEYIDWPDMQEPSCFPDVDPSQYAVDEEGQDLLDTPDQGDYAGDISEAILSGQSHVDQDADDDGADEEARDKNDPGNHEFDPDLDEDVWDGDDNENQEQWYSQVDDGANPIPPTPTLVIPRWYVSRRNEWKENRQVIRWERPAQAKVKEGTCVCADGKIVQKNYRRRENPWDTLQ